MNGLLEVEKEAFYILDKKTTPDGYGGVVTDFVNGAKIYAIIVFDNSTEARIAEQQGVKNLYTVITDKKVVLMANDFIRRETDGKVFRITSDGHDSKPPKTASIQIRQVSAEEYEI